MLPSPRETTADCQCHKAKEQGAQTKILEEAGLPPTLSTSGSGPGSTIGDAFITHLTPRVISFTGSTPMGRRIARLAVESPIIKQVELELGGNGPFVVLDDTDLDQAVDAAVFGRFIVDDRVYEPVLDRFVERIRALKAGNPDEPDTMTGHDDRTDHQRQPVAGVA